MSKETQERINKQIQEITPRHVVYFLDAHEVEIAQAITTNGGKVKLKFAVTIDTGEVPPKIKTAFSIAPKTIKDDVDTDMEDPTQPTLFEQPVLPESAEIPPHIESAEDSTKTEARPKKRKKGAQPA